MHIPLSGLVFATIITYVTKHLNDCRGTGINGCIYAKGHICANHYVNNRFAICWTKALWICKMNEIYHFVPTSPMLIHDVMRFCQYRGHVTLAATTKAKVDLKIHEDVVSGLISDWKKSSRKSKSKISGQ